MSTTKIILSKKDKQTVDQQLRYNPVHWWLINTQRYNFEVGDVLIKKVYDTWNHDDPTKNTFKTQFVSDTSKIPRRYKVVYKDQFGVPYVKTMLVNDKLGSHLTCLAANVNPYDSYYQVDPDYAVHVMFEEKENFTVSQQYKDLKKERSEITKKNRKMRIKLRTIQEVHSFIANLKVGQVFWYARVGQDAKAHDSDVKVLGIKPVHLNTNDWQYNLNEQTRKMLNDAKLKVTYKVQISSPYWGHSFEFDPSYLLNGYVYLTKPHSYETLR